MTALSVVLPVYNGARTLDRALASVDCEGADIEILAVDQASTDGSRDILEAWARRLPLKIIDAPDSTAWTTTTNVGLRSATAPLAVMLHQDDAWTEGFVGAVLRSAEEWPEAALWLHPAWYVDDNDRRIGRFAPPFGSRARLVPRREALETLLVQNTVALPGAVFRREAAMAGGGLAPALWYTADWDLWLRLAKLGPVGWHPAPIAHFRLHEASQTMKGSEALDDFADQLARPLDQHIASAPDETRAEVLRLAQTSNLINLRLAAAHHGGKDKLPGIWAAILSLGPAGFLRLLRRTRLLQRVLPRLRLRLGL